MTERIITKEMAECAITGGAVLGGGGGGSMKKGHAIVKAALTLGDIRLVDIDDVRPDAILVTASAVGAPAATEAQALPADYVRVVDILAANCDEKRRDSSPTSAAAAPSPTDGSPRR